MGKSLAVTTKKKIGACANAKACTACYWLKKIKEKLNEKTK